MEYRLLPQGGASGKEPARQYRRHTGLIPERGKIPGGGNANLLQYSCLENPMDREAWCVGYGP